MTRFLSQQQVTGDNGKIFVMTRPTDNLDAMAARAPQVISEAKRRLDSTRVALCGDIEPSVVQLAHRYFLTGAASLPVMDLNFVKTILELVRNGLGADVTIKLSNLDVGKQGTNPRGVVRNRPLSAAHTPRSHQNIAANLETHEERRRGAIRMSISRFESDLGVKTFIHEASHKYAGTIDYCYFKDDGITPRGAFDNKAKALINADSFAWFVYEAGA